MNKPRVSIIVLCYNGLQEATRPCLESLITNTNTPMGSYELIIVDNASSDGTADYLKTFSAQHLHVHIQLNDSNKGYAGGNNDGIRLAKGQYIILLNNDTLVPSGWLDRLVKLFDHELSVGLIGPVTNSAGNEQRIELAGLNEQNYEAISSAHIEGQQGRWFTTEKLGFFCVAMRHEVLNKVGYLDENFGIGMFEDDDYCIRAKNAGFTLGVAEDCFVYHKGSVSFKKLSDADYIELFNKNRDYFFEKNGILWLYTDIAVSIWAKMRDDLISAREKGDPAAIERVLMRLNGMNDAFYRLRVVEQGSAVVGGKAFNELQLAEKQRALMEISDWATDLKQQLAEKHRVSIEISDWATDMKREMDEMSSSFFYRIFRFFQRRGI